MPHLLRHVWHLVIWDEELSHGDYKELFSIGVFSSRFRAWRTAKRYLQRVPGFRDHPCRYSITRRAVRGVAVKGSCIRCVLGWNLNANGDEIDLVYSEFFSHRRMLYETMDRMRRAYDRSEWICCTYRVDECRWQEGFDRSQPDDG